MSFGDVDPDTWFATWEQGRVPATMLPWTLSGSRLVELRAGDLVIPRGPEQEYGPWLFGAVQLSDLPMAADETTVVLRPIGGLSVEQVHFIAEFLDRERNEGMLASNRGGAPITELLANVSVPVPGDEIMAARTGLRQAAETLRAWAAEATALDDELFLRAKTLGEVRHVLVEEGRPLRERVTTARQLDDLGFRVRTMFPYPVAYRWRTVEATRADMEGYRTVLWCAESLLCYAAMVALTMAAANGAAVNYVRSIANNLSTRATGTSLGDWIAVLREIRGERYGKLGEDIPLGDVRRLLADKAVDEAVQRMAERRNAYSHFRESTGAGAVPGEYAAARNDIEVLARQMELVADYRLIYVESFAWDSFSDSGAVAYRELRGDHPLVPQQHMDYRAVLDTGSLYLSDRSGTLHLAKPYLIGQHCPECGTWSTFHLDRYDPKQGRLELKSFEHGHPVHRDDLIPVMKRVGLLG
jgi:hypothetical protein